MLTLVTDVCVYVSVLQRSSDFYRCLYRYHAAVQYLLGVTVDHILYCRSMDADVCYVSMLQITSSECPSWSAWSRWRDGWQRWPPIISRAVEEVQEEEQEQVEEEVVVVTTARHR